jgi:hypothetical protein
MAPLPAAPRRTNCRASVTPARFLPRGPGVPAARSSDFGLFGRGTRFAPGQGELGMQEAAMSVAASAEYRTYWKAIQERACAVCLDVADDGSCGLPHGRTCALGAQLPTIVETILHVKSERMGDYVTAIENVVCARCPETDARGRCGLRDEGACALYTYLPLVVDAIEEVKTGRTGR